MAAAFQAIDRPAIPAATAAISTIQRIAGSLGTVLLAVTLQRAITVQLPGFRGGITQAAALAAANPARALPALASAFGTTFWVALALTAASLAPALLLPRRPAGEPPGQRTPQPTAHAAGERPAAAAGQAASPAISPTRTGHTDDANKQRTASATRGASAVPPFPPITRRPK
jgi:hypothetical protein